MKLHTRVRFPDKPFLGEGYICKIIKPYRSEIYVIKLDEKAPNEYAWETDEVMSFGFDIEEVPS